MANTILLKRSGTAGKVPVTANLSIGELSVNYTDGRLYTTTGSAIVDLSQNDKITLSGDATGTSTNPAAGGNYSNLAVTLSSTGVTAGNYGSATLIPTIVVDAKGRISSITTNAISTSFTLAAGSGSGSVAGGGTLTVSGGTGITTSVTGSTYTITNSGVTSAVAGTGVSVSGATGAVTVSIGQSVATSATPTFAGLVSTGTVIAATVNAATIGNSGATLTGTLSTAAQTNITSVGTLTSLIVGGNENVTGTLTAATVNAATIGNSGATLTGTLSTAAQTNITSVGTLTGLTTSGTIIAATLNAATIGNSGATLTGTLSTASQPNITTLAGVTSIGASSSTTLTGTLQTAAQPNITSTGTLTGLTVSGQTNLQGNVSVTGPGEFVTNNLVVTGNFYVAGNNITLNSTSVSTNDLYYVAAANAATSSAANGAGLLTPYSSFTYNSANTAWASNIALYATALYDNNNRVLTTATSHSNSGGDASVSGAYNAMVLTLNTVNTNVGTFGNATYNQGLTVNGKGLVTGVSNILITPAFSSLTGTPTTISGYGITDALSSSSTIDGGTY